MCDKAVDYCFAALQLVPNWFVTSKMAEIVFTAFYADKNLLILYLLVMEWVFLI